MLILLFLDVAYLEGTETEAEKLNLRKLTFSSFLWLELVKSKFRVPYKYEITN